MRIQKLRIRNFRAIKNMVLDNLENALILVGKNSTGKQPYWKLSARSFMRIQKLRIRNFRAIKNMVLDNLENALILVGKNSTGKQPYWKLSAWWQERIR